ATSDPAIARLWARPGVAHPPSFAALLEHALVSVTTPLTRRRRLGHFDALTNRRQGGQFEGYLPSAILQRAACAHGATVRRADAHLGPVAILAPLEVLRHEGEREPRRRNHLAGPELATRQRRGTRSALRQIVARRLPQKFDELRACFWRAVRAAQAQQKPVHHDVRTARGGTLLTTQRAQRQDEQQQVDARHRGASLARLVRPRLPRRPKTWLHYPPFTYNVAVRRQDSPKLEWAGKSITSGGRSAPGHLLPELAQAAVRLIRGDNLHVLEALAARETEAVTFAYLDPPFLTGKVHHQVTRTKNQTTGQTERQTRPAFDDRW